MAPYLDPINRRGHIIRFLKLVEFISFSKRATAFAFLSVQESVCFIFYCFCNVVCTVYLIALSYSVLSFVECLLPLFLFFISLDVILYHLLCWSLFQLLLLSVFTSVSKKFNFGAK